MSRSTYSEAQSDEEIAKAVLGRLGDGPAREIAERLPISYGPVQNWKNGRFGMNPKTKRLMVAWLNGHRHREEDPEAAAKLAAARYMETFAAQLRREVEQATARVEGVHRDRDDRPSVETISRDGKTETPGKGRGVGS